MSVRAIVTDIEGTTTSIAFVFDVLFPYARAHLGDYVRTRLDDAAVREALAEIDTMAGRPLSTDEAVAELTAWIDADRKVTPLKTLQGLVWRQGYSDGDFTGHVYPDAVEYLRRWHAAGLRLYVYSSGSVAAQKLLFGHSDAGDLTPLFSGYFDTRTGAKREAASYRRIVAELGFPAGEILFLSDITEELDAAREAGLRTAWLVRDPRTDTSGASHPPCADFSTVPLGG